MCVCEDALSSVYFVVHSQRQEERKKGQRWIPTCTYNRTYVMCAVDWTSVLCVSDIVTTHFTVCNMYSKPNRQCHSGNLEHVHAWRVLAMEEYQIFLRSPLILITVTSETQYNLGRIPAKILHNLIIVSEELQIPNDPHWSIHMQNSESKQTSRSIDSTNRYQFFWNYRDYNIHVLNCRVHSHGVLSMHVHTTSDPTNLELYSCDAIHSFVNMHCGFTYNYYS